MLNINKTVEASAAVLALEGRLDTVTSPVLESELNALWDEINSLTLDFAGVDYISSAGLRVLLLAKKRMDLKGEMKLINVCETIMEIFEVTGFSEILTIE